MFILSAKEARAEIREQSEIDSVLAKLEGLEVRFGREDERLTIAYDGGPGAQPYISGTLLAIRRVPDFTDVVRGVDRIL